MLLVILLAIIAAVAVVFHISLSARATKLYAKQVDGDEAAAEKLAHTGNIFTALAIVGVLLGVLLCFMIENSVTDNFLFANVDSYIMYSMGPERLVGSAEFDDYTLICVENYGVVALESSNGRVREIHGKGATKRDSSAVDFVVEVHRRDQADYVLVYGDADKEVFLGDEQLTYIGSVRGSAIYGILKPTIDNISIVYDGNRVDFESL